MSGERLRWAIFTVSIISSVDNPGAHFWRAVGRRLQRRAHLATFFEPRGNPALHALLRSERSGGLTAFRERFPDLHYQTVEQRSGFMLAEWLTRTLSTVDIALVDRNASPELIAALSEFSRPFLQTFVVDLGWSGEPIEAMPLANFTGILVGNETLGSAYERLDGAARVYRFGPLPAKRADDEPTGNESAELEAAADEAIATVSRVSEKIRQAQGTQIVTNGRSHHDDPLEPHRPD
jgi:hypothetical protein